MVRISDDLGQVQLTPLSAQDQILIKRLSLVGGYGENLTPLRVPRENIDANLREEGLVRFLRQDWRGKARLVLTTYEALRDLEFSFAQESWSIIVCDEAQKIKNPNAMITRAAKKQNVRFRVACTGTPVESASPISGAFMISSNLVFSERSTRSARIMAGLSRSCRNTGRKGWPSCAAR